MGACCLHGIGDTLMIASGVPTALATIMKKEPYAANLATRSSPQVVAGSNLT
jgi:hypothetical protein